MNELDKLLTELNAIAEERGQHVHVEEACNLTWIRGIEVERYRRGNSPVAGVWISKRTGKLIDKNGSVTEMLSPTPTSPLPRKKRKGAPIQREEDGGLWG